MENETQHPVLQQLNTQIENLQSQLTASQDSVMRLRDKYRTAEIKVEALLKELLADDLITTEIAERFVEIFDNISLTKQVEINYTVTGTITVEVPFGMAEHEIVNNTYIDRVEAEAYDEIEVLEVSFDTDSFYIN